MDGYGSSDGSADFEDLDDDEVWRAEDDGKGWVMGGRARRSPLVIYMNHEISQWGSMSTS